MIIRLCRSTIPPLFLAIVGLIFWPSTSFGFFGAVVVKKRSVAAGPAVISWNAPNYWLDASTYPTETVTLTNTGSSPTGAITVGLTGNPFGYFWLSNNTCNAVVLPPSGSCTVDINYANFGNSSAQITATDGTINATPSNLSGCWGCI